MVALPENLFESGTVAAIWKAIEEEIAQRPQYEGYGISASELGHECDRKLFYTLRWVSPAEKVTGRKQRIFWRGDIEETRVIKDLKRAGIDVEEFDMETGNQWRFSLANGWLRGKADGKATGIIEAPVAEHVIEIKSAKAADWRAIKEHGLKKKKPEHWHQLHAGMGGLGIDRGLYIVVNKDTDEIWAERIKFDPEEMTKQAARVLGVVEAHTAPQRLSDDRENFACRFCKHKDVCHAETLPRINCRTCIHIEFGSDGNGHCTHFDKPLTPQSQRQGEHCPKHLYLPALVPFEQIDADPEAETITYQKPDGTTWANRTK